jgi:hypothetical protein
VPNIKKYTDEFQLDTKVGEGTTLTLKGIHEVRRDEGTSDQGQGTRESELQLEPLLPRSNVFGASRFARRPFPASSIP